MSDWSHRKVKPIAPVNSEIFKQKHPLEIVASKILLNSGLNFILRKVKEVFNFTKDRLCFLVPLGKYSQHIFAVHLQLATSIIM